MAVADDGRYYAEAEIKGKGAPEIRAKLDEKLNGEPRVSSEAPVPEPNTSVDPANHPAAGGQKTTESSTESKANKGK
jgi:hypothetical protein